MIDDIVSKKSDEIEHVDEKDRQYKIMNLSEASFAEWDNAEDEVYNEL